MKRDDQHELVHGHRRPHFGLTDRLGDLRADREQPPAGGELVATSGTAVAPRVDERLLAPSREQPRARRPPCLDQGGRVRRKATLTLARLAGSIGSKLDLVEHALAQPAEPAMEGREVQWRKLRRGRPQPSPARAVGLGRRLDHRKAVGLVGKQIGGKHAGSATAVAAPREGELYRARRFEDHPPTHSRAAEAAPRPRKVKAVRASAAIAARPLEVDTDLAASLSEVGRVGIMEQWYAVRDGFGWRSLLFGHARWPPGVPILRHPEPGTRRRRCAPGRRPRPRLRR